MEVIHWFSSLLGTGRDWDVPRSLCEFCYGFYPNIAFWNQSLSRETDVIITFYKEQIFNLLL